MNTTECQDRSGGRRRAARRRCGGRRARTTAPVAGAAGASTRRIGRRRRLGGRCTGRACSRRRNSSLGRGRGALLRIPSEAENRDPHVAAAEGQRLVAAPHVEVDLAAAAPRGRCPSPSRSRCSDRPGSRRESRCRAAAAPDRRRPSRCAPRCRPRSSRPCSTRSRRSGTRCRGAAVPVRRRCPPASSRARSDDEHEHHQQRRRRHRHRASREGAGHRVLLATRAKCTNPAGSAASPPGAGQHAAARSLVTTPMRVSGVAVRARTARRRPSARAGTATSSS